MSRDLEAGATPATTFGYLTEALRRRRDRGNGAFTVMSCDNMQANGRKTQHALVTFAKAKDTELADWIAREVRFPNSMVDRITPVTTDQDRSELKDGFGIDDDWPVVAEPFFQWVLEDKFSGGRPPYERGGVQIVQDVVPYEMMKLRLLNAGHQAIAYFGALSGFRYVHEAGQDPVFAAFLLAYMHQEAIPTLQPVPGIDLDDYCRTLIERFSNSEVRDTISRLCANSSDRIPTFLIPVILDNLAVGQIRLSAAIVASWARYAECVDEQGRPLVLADRRGESLRAAAARWRDDPTGFLADQELFGDLRNSPRFVAAYVDALKSLWTRGAYQTVADLTR
jgi:mannitol 2-dehydrogenase